MKRPRMLVAISLVLLVGLVLAGCAAPEPEVVEKVVTREVEKVVAQEVVKEVTRVVEQEVIKEVRVDPSGDVPFGSQWASSGHADTEAEAFRHWDEDDPAVVPTGCAKCHSAYGYLDFVGADGTEAGVVDNEAKIDSVINCVTCHNEATLVMTSVVFPSGVEITGLGDESRCMQCHQGRASTAVVDQKIQDAGLTEDLDKVAEDLGFTNIHYYAAAATQAGGTAKGGYQYEGKVYDAKFVHVEGYDTCIGCHNPHTLEVRVKECATCHEGVTTADDLKNVRMEGSLVDYDGDGDLKEGIYYEIEGLRDMLYQGMQAYAGQVAGTKIAYNAGAYPYFFADTNGDGKAEGDEATSANAFKAWTARLTKAAYNYQTSLKDPGAFAHGGKYVIQFLYDSIEDLNAELTQPVDLSQAHRIDDGHFAGSEEAFRHWDEEAAVPASCAKCHSATGLPLFLSEGVNISAPQANGFLCSTCHDSLTEYTRYAVGQVEFPSGSVVSDENPNTNLCMNCHQGRESTVSVNNLVQGIGGDEQSEKLRFLNVHYFAAGATLFGSEAMGGYQYDGQEYAGRNAHVAAYDDCTECHSAHGLDVKVEGCATCHSVVKSEEDLHKIRVAKTDYDGDGNTEEGIADEISALHEALYAAMQGYASDTIGSGIVYDAHAYPYFFVDTNGNGVADADEATRTNGFSAWTPRLLRAAYNYQYVAKDPGGFAHNGAYVIQLLYDAMQGLGADTSSFTRP